MSQLENADSHGELENPMAGLVRTTVRIEGKSENETSYGTGFLFTFLADEFGNGVPAIVTNKHVINGISECTFHFRLTTESSIQYGGAIHTPIQLENIDRLCIKHPDPSIDLAAILLGPILNQAERANLEFDIRILDKAALPSEEILTSLTPMENVVMIGYPNGLWDQKHNMPIIRKGITATHPSLDLNGKDEFLIDAACFPGSSGSPVFLADISQNFLKKERIVVGTRIALLGVLYGGPMYTADGEIQVIEIPSSTKPISFTGIPMNLGCVLSAKKLLDLEPLIQTRAGNNSKSAG